jgi:hypothetical protein
MHSEVKIYKIADLIRVNKEGKLDLDRSIRLVHELAATAAFHADHNILVDLRDTTIATHSLDDLIEIVLEMGRFKSIFKNKMASVIPNDEQRISIAQKLKACMNIKGFQFQFFTVFEDAIEWLSVTKQLNTADISPLHEG